MLSNFNFKVYIAGGEGWKDYCPYKNPLIEFIGYVDNPQDLYCNYDVFIAPSLIDMGTKTCVKLCHQNSIDNFKEYGCL